MKLGVMQPYIFPYIGYFQLVSAVDRFVLYDDVTYIKQGWINRNKILLDGKEHIFTVPLRHASSFVTIARTEINHDLYTAWCSKFLKTVTQAYKKAPYFEQANELVTEVLNSNGATIADFAINGIVATCNYIGISTQLVRTATNYGNGDLKGQDRIIDICRREGATAYINAIGGKDLYSKKDFADAGIELNFIRSENVQYAQQGSEFVPWLSVIDVMMYNSPEEIRQLLTLYTLE